MPSQAGSAAWHIEQRPETVSTTLAKCASLLNRSNAGASGGKNNATTAGSYYKGMAVFTVVKGGAMLEMSIAGQKFKYEKKK